MEKGKSFKFTIIDYKNITFKFLKDSIINKLYKIGKLWRYYKEIYEWIKNIIHRD